MSIHLSFNYIPYKTTNTMFAHVHQCSAEPLYTDCICMPYTHILSLRSMHTSVFWMQSVQRHCGENVSQHFDLCCDLYKFVFAMLLISPLSSPQMRKAWSVSSIRVTAGPTAHVAPTQSGYATPACPAWPTASCVLIPASVPSVRMATGSLVASARLPSAEWVSLSCHIRSFSPLVKSPFQQMNPVPESAKC